MKFRFFRLFCILFLSVLFLNAEEVFTVPQIEEAVNDGLYELAEEQIWKALSIERTDEERSKLTILLVRTLGRLGKTDYAVTLAEESSHLSGQDALTYWKARVQYDKGDFGSAFQSLEDFPDDSPLTAAALRLRGRAAQSSGDLKEAQRTFEQFNKQFPDDDNAAQNLLDLANVQLERNKERAAAETLQMLLNRFPESVLADSARLMLARELTNGSAQDREQAGRLFRFLGEAENAHPRLRIAAWSELAAIQQQDGKAGEAAESIGQAERLSTEATQLVLQRTAQANLLIEAGRADEALQIFETAFEQAPDTASAAQVLLQKAEVLLKLSKSAEAEAAFQAYLDVAADPSGQARALSGKGWSLWQQERYEEAATSFENAAGKVSGTAAAADALIKAGDSRLAAKQYQLAFTDYQMVMSAEATEEQKAHALYQSGVTRLLADNRPEAQSLFEQTETGFPSSPFAAQAGLRLAELLKFSKDWNGALEAYRRIDAQYTNRNVRATAQHQQGLILYRLGRWSDALEAFNRVRENWPDEPDAPQALYMAGFVRYLQGETEEALAICRGFVETYPDSPWTPEVLFWLAEHDYNRGRYAEAGESFLNVTVRMPGHELADDALFWAGMALMKNDSFLDAFNLFSRLAKEYPQSPLLLRTRFAQGESLSELGEFARAILAYDEIISIDPDAPLADRARGRRADCLFTLGNTDSLRYQEAITAYQMLYKRPSAPFGLKLQALYKTGRCREQTGDTDLAFERYMEAVYSATTYPDTLSPDAVLWFTRAAFDAAAIQEKQGFITEAAQIYQHLVDAQVPAAGEAQKRIDQLHAGSAGETGRSQ